MSFSEVNLVDGNTRYPDVEEQISANNVFNMDRLISGLIQLVETHHDSGELAKYLRIMTAKSDYGHSYILNESACHIESLYFGVAKILSSMLKIQAQKKAGK